MKALSIDLGGTHAACAIVDGTTLVATETIATDRGKGLQPLLPVFAGTFGKLLSKTGIAPKDCLGVAFGFAGLVNTRTGRVLSTNEKYDDALAVNLPAWIKDSFRLPFRIENDARMALLGECFAGAAREISYAVLLPLVTGTGGPPSAEGKLLPVSAS